MILLVISAQIPHNLHPLYHEAQPYDTSHIVSKPLS